MARKKKQSLADRLRDAVDASDLSWYRVAKEIGVVPSTMGRFMNGEGDLQLRNLEPLLNLLGFEVVQKSRKRR